MSIGKKEVSTGTAILMLYFCSKSDWQCFGWCVGKNTGVKKYGGNFLEQIL